MMPIPSAQAAVKLLPEKTAWFWSSNTSITTVVKDPSGTTTGVNGGVSGSTGVFGNANGAAPPISRGHLGVAMKDGGSDMRSYLRFELPRDFIGASVRSFELTLLAALPTDDAHANRHSQEEAKPPASLNASAAAIRACLMRLPFGPSEGDPPRNTEVIPPEPGGTEYKINVQQNEADADCSVQAPGRVAADGKTWTFDISRIAQGWADCDDLCVVGDPRGKGFLNEGIALLPVDMGLAPTWTVEFHGSPITEEDLAEQKHNYVNEAEAARADIDYTPGAAPPPPPPPPTGGVQFPSFGNPLPSIQPPLTTTPAIPPVQPPTQAPVVAVGGVFANTPLWFYIVLFAGLGGLYWLSREIGADPLTAGAGSRVTTRVARVLRQRRLNGGLGDK
jgi:hypothetical protein